MKKGDTVLSQFADWQRDKLLLENLVMVSFVRNESVWEESSRSSWCGWTFTSVQCANWLKCSHCTGRRGYISRLETPDPSHYQAHLKLSCTKPRGPTASKQPDPPPRFLVSHPGTAAGRRKTRRRRRGWGGSRGGGGARGRGGVRAARQIYRWNVRNNPIMPSGSEASASAAGQSLSSSLGSTTRGLAGWCETLMLAHIRGPWGSRRIFHQDGE